VEDETRAINSICLSCAVWIFVGNALAAPAPKIPPGELAGRQRERFVDPPIARFFQPALRSEPLLTIQPACRPRAARRSKQRSKRIQGC
jgi:hypothetical protein